MSSLSRLSLVPLHVLIGSSPAIVELRERTAVAARSDARTLITGEPGSGKEVVAHLLHQGGRRARRRMVVVNCADVPEGLLETELFGCVPGSGAFRDRPGLLEQADGGTAYLDEIGEAGPRMQGAILRFLETGTLQRSGSAAAPREVDVRLVAATSCGLEDRVSAGGFRAELYRRLNAVHLHVPPLRERAGDVPDLLLYFLTRYSAEYRLVPPSIGGGALEVLVEYGWPGNVLELKNLAERLVVRAPGCRIESFDMAAWLSEPGERRARRPAAGV